MKWLTEPRRGHTPAYDGARQGIFMAHAMAAPPAAFLFLILGHWFLGGLMVTGAILGWAGWKRDYNLSRRYLPPEGGWHR